MAIESCLLGVDSFDHLVREVGRGGNRVVQLLASRVVRLLALALHANIGWRGLLMFGGCIFEDDRILGVDSGLVVHDGDFGCGRYGGVVLRFCGEGKSKCL